MNLPRPKSIFARIFLTALLPVMLLAVLLSTYAINARLDDLAAAHAARGNAQAQQANQCTCRQAAGHHAQHRYGKRTGQEDDVHDGPGLRAVQDQQVTTPHGAVGLNIRVLVQKQQVTGKKERHQ